MIMVQGAQIAWREVRAIVVGLMGLTLLGLGARRRWLAALAGVTLLWVFSSVVVMSGSFRIRWISCEEGG